MKFDCGGSVPDLKYGIKRVLERTAPKGDRRDKPPNRIRWGRRGCKTTGAAAGACGGWISSSTPSWSVEDTGNLKQALVATRRAGDGPIT
jgi:hypothetical protein